MTTARPAGVLATAHAVNDGDDARQVADPRRAATADDYIAALPAAGRGDVVALRALMRRMIPADYEEMMQYGMISYSVPHERYPGGYHCDPKQPVPFAGLALRKGYLSLSLFCVYLDPDRKARFVAGWQASGHRLDMGAGCVRVKSAAAVPTEVLAEAFRFPIDDFVAVYEAGIPASARRQARGMRG